eukprot:5565716-Prymnesium_polylepis.1
MAASMMAGLWGDVSHTLTAASAGSATALKIAVRASEAAVMERCTARLMGEADPAHGGGDGSGAPSFTVDAALPPVGAHGAMGADRSAGAA